MRGSYAEADWLTRSERLLGFHAVALLWIVLRSHFWSHKDCLHNFLALYATSWPAKAPIATKYHVGTQDIGIHLQYHMRSFITGRYVEPLDQTTHSSSGMRCGREDSTLSFFGDAFSITEQRYSLACL